MLFRSVALAALALTAIGLLAIDGPFFSLPSSFLGGAAVAGAIALINAVGSLGAAAGPIVVGLLKDRSGSYAQSMAALAAMLLAAAAVTALLGRRMSAKP